MKGYKGRSIGAARAVAVADLSDGTSALEILNFHMNDRGYLDSTFRLMPLIPNQWRGSSQPDALAKVYAMAFVLLFGETPELLFLTDSGVFRYAPWRRAAGGINPGLVEAKHWIGGGQQESVTPQGQMRFPPQVEVLGNRVYFTFCDGGVGWVWDGRRIRPFGFPDRPQPPSVNGPQRDVGGSANAGGFAFKGRIGDTNTTWVDPTLATAEVVGGIDIGRWQYWTVLEGHDGAYSATSAAGGIASIRQALADDSTVPAADRTLPEEMRRKFHLHGLHTGQFAALLLLRSRNLDRLPTGDDGSPRFLHRIPGGLADEWVDDIPDGELGPVWINREVTPTGFYFIGSYGGSTWLMRTDGNPSRVWWSEQESLNGPTPESIIEGHWRDVFPGTGGLTGHLNVQFGDSGESVMLLFKEQAVHYAAGQYPRWSFGTLRGGAGLAGPNLAQNCPDGTAVWYGARTFWQFSGKGVPVDIGGPVRRFLSRVNHTTAHMGTSYVDVRRGEVVYRLPIDDSARPNFGFVYDARVGGMRMLDEMTVDAALVLPGLDLVLLAGTFAGVRTVYASGRGYPGYAVVAPTARYTTGWMSFSPPGPELHAAHNARLAIVTGSERHEGTATLRTFADWSLDPVGDSTRGTEVGALALAHPENDFIPYYDPGATDPATYDVDLWRSRRAFTQRQPIGEHSVTVFAVEIETANPVALINVDAYGPRVADASGGRSAEAED